MSNLRASPNMRPITRQMRLARCSSFGNSGMGCGCVMTPTLLETVSRSLKLVSRVPHRITRFSTHRNRERERRAHTLLTLHPNLAAVQFHKLSTQGEPEPRALDFLRSCPHLAELLEDLLLILGGDAVPVSLTETSTSPSFGTALMSMRPPSGVNLMAFDKRFRTTWRTLRSSA